MGDGISGWSRRGEGWDIGGCRKAAKPTIFGPQEAEKGRKNGSKNDVNG
jgi:hypothetical protein